MRFDHQRRLAASILGCGVNRVRITTDPAEQENIFDAITREQVRELVRRNVITKREEIGVSRSRARLHAAQKAKGRRRGQGHEREKDKDDQPQGTNHRLPRRAALRSLFTEI